MRALISFAFSSPYIPVGGESLYSFKCESKKGALLLLKGGGATQETLVPNTVFPEYMLDHHDSWYRLATEQGHRMEREDLIMVKGTVKAADWSLAAFHDKNDHRSFKFEVKSAASALAGFSWSRSVVSVEHRSRESKVPAPPPDAAQQTKDQCVFLSRYMMRRRRNLWSWSPVAKFNRAKRSRATDSDQSSDEHDGGDSDEKPTVRRHGGKKSIKVKYLAPAIKYTCKQTQTAVHRAGILFLFFSTIFSR